MVRPSYMSDENWYDYVGPYLMTEIIKRDLICVYINIGVFRIAKCV